MKKDWKLKKLGEVCSIELGKTPYRKDKSYWDIEKQTNNVWISIADMQNTKDKYVYDSKEYISDKAVPISKIVKKGTLLLSFKLTIGRLAFAGKDLFTNEAIAALTIKDEKEIDKFYLYNYLTFFDWDKVTKGERKVKGKTLNKAKLKELDIIIPPLPEQKRIVSILDRAFEAIDQAKANAEQNLNNAKELFESYLQGVFENKGYDWEEKRFDEVCVLQRGFDLPTRLRNKGIFPLVSSNGITDYVDVWKIKSPGVSTGRSGTIGKVHFIEEDYWPLNTSLYIKEFHGNYEKFIYYFLRQFDLSRYASGAGVPTLNRNNVHSEKVYFPKSIETQKQIVKKLDELQAETKKLEEIYQQKIVNLEEMKKSVLQKAFNGELKTDVIQITEQV